MLSIDVKGLEESQHLLRVVSAMGSSIKAVELNAKDRHEENSNSNNFDVVDGLSEHGKDFFSPSDEMMREIDKTMAAVLEQELTKQTLGRAKSGKSEKTVAQSVAAKAFIAAMEVYKKTVVDRIESQKTATGASPTALNPKYAAWKEKKFGFKEPIGKATGQLLDNFAPGSRNIRLKR